MPLRIIDYVANAGGGIRFAAQLGRSLQELTGASLEVVSHGAALETYARALRGNCRLIDVAPVNARRARTIFPGWPGAGLLNRLLGAGQFSFEVPAAALRGPAAIWLPWIHRHRIPWEMGEAVVASLHDVIMIDSEGLVPATARAEEKNLLQAWTSSAARIVVSSRTTVSRLGALFGAEADRFRVIPLSGDHAKMPADGSRRQWPFSGKRFVLCPTNLMRHKNVDVLLTERGCWGRHQPLVLTGSGTQLAGWDARRRELRRVAREAGLVEGRDLFALGYLSDQEYEQLLLDAWALVCPTLAEGGGSFPVMEAMLRGIPVICSEIPVLREMVERMGGEPIWFDAQRPGDFAEKLGRLRLGYVDERRRCMAQRGSLRGRTWADVAMDYAQVMGLPVQAGSVR